MSERSTPDGIAGGTKRDPARSMPLTHGGRSWPGAGIESVYLRPDTRCRQVSGAWDPGRPLRREPVSLLAYQHEVMP
jgi:hypothetical protein